RERGIKIAPTADHPSNSADRAASPAGIDSLFIPVTISEQGLNRPRAQVEREIRSEESLRPGTAVALILHRLHGTNRRAPMRGSREMPAFQRRGGRTLKAVRHPAAEEIKSVPDCPGALL